MTFLAMGVPIMQGYGLTETSPVITASQPSANEYGAVGRPIPGVDVKIARGRRSARAQDATSCKATIATAKRPRGARDGWLHTGDIGEIDAHGFLRITDRKNEVFKTGHRQMDLAGAHRGERSSARSSSRRRW